MRKIYFLFLSLAVFFAASCENYDDRFNDLNNQVTALQSQVSGITALQSEVTSLKSTIATIQSSLTALKDLDSKVSSLDGKVSSLDSKVSSLDEKVTAVEPKVATLETNQTAIVAHINENFAKITKNNAEIISILQGLDERLTALEKSLKELETRQKTQEQVNEIKDSVEEEINEIKETLKEELEGSAEFYTPPRPLDISSRAGLQFLIDNHSDVTGVNADISINTTGWSDADISDLQGWVKDIKLVTGDLDIIHPHDPETKAIKFEALASVTNLEDGQPHVHYPSLTSASEITLSSRVVKTVRLPEITRTKFAGNAIKLDNASELLLPELTSYAGGLSIALDSGSELDLSSLEQLTAGNKTLSISGPSSVELSSLTTLNELYVEDVGNLKAINVRGVALEVGPNVTAVDVGTANRANIKLLDISKAADLEELKIRGTNEVAVDITRSIRTAHIHGAKYVKAITPNGTLGDFVTSGEIKVVELIDTNIRNLTLEHESGIGGSLVVEDNLGLRTLTADNLNNNLATLTIQGNKRLESISFNGLRRAVSGAEVLIGGVDNENNLIADKIHLAAGEQSGAIEDNSGLADLERFLRNVTKAAVYYDGAVEFKEHAGATPYEIKKIDDSNKEFLVLFRKGFSNASSGTKAKRVFIIDDDDYNNDLDTYGGTITIGANGAFKPITIDTGDSLGNWKGKVNETKDHFSPSKNNTEVDIEATTGGWRPRGKIIFGGQLSGTVDTNVIGKIKPGAYIELKIGDHSHKVYLKGGTETEETFLNGNNKKAISNVILSATSTGEDIINELVSAFPIELGLVPRIRRELDPRQGGFPYSVEFFHKNIVIKTYDKKQISEKIEVSLNFDDSLIHEDVLKEILFGPSSSSVSELYDGDPIDNQRKKTTLIITLTSQVAGYSESTIGQPVDASTLGIPTTGLIFSNSNDDAWVEFKTNGTSYLAYELVAFDSNENKNVPAPDYKYWSESGTPGAPQFGVDPVEGSAVKESDLNRLNWL